APPAASVLGAGDRRAAGGGPVLHRACVLHSWPGPAGARSANRGRHGVGGVRPGGRDRGPGIGGRGPGRRGTRAPIRGARARRPRAPGPDPQEAPFLFSPYSLPVEPEAFPALAGLSPMYPVLLCQVYNDRVASACKLLLMERYPDEHPVSIVLNAGVEGQERV